MSDYIDREALIKSMDDVGKKFSITVANRCNFREILRMAPAADVAPIRHARFIKRKEDALVHWDCSECGVAFLDDRGLEKLLYCPHCGAKMDEGENHP